MKERMLEAIVRDSHVPQARWVGRSRDERSAEILLALARGIDELKPADGPEMKRRERAIEALIAGAQALRGEMHENAGRRWDEAEEERLREAVWAGMSLAETAKLLGRSERAVWMKLEKLTPAEISKESRKEAVQSAWNRLRKEKDAE